MAEEDDEKYADQNPKDYKVGYGRPPQGTRFRKGQSGNPSGRPRKKPSDGELLRRELERPMIVQLDGKRTKTNRKVLMYRSMSTQAAKGEHQARRDTLGAMKAFGLINTDSGREEVLSPEQLAVLRRLLKRDEPNDD